MPADRSTDRAIERAVRIARRVKEAGDRDVRAAIEKLDEPDFGNRQSLAIAESAWQQVSSVGIAPRLVFAHPTVLEAIPRASIHYRGISLLSRKRVSDIAGVGVDNWEKGSVAKVRQERALKVARLYNAVISSIIVDSADWTLEDGYRNILATIGISEDGSMRNFIGQQGERAIREKLLTWVEDSGLLASEQTEDGATEWNLTGGVRMVFASEPDIGFWKNSELAVVIEIKAGTDPAGALERLGAIKKSFDESPASCRNFLIAAVQTATMAERLREMRMERSFDMDTILGSEQGWNEFANEIFHHALRIAPEVPSQ